MTTQETPKQVLDKLGRFIDQQETARASAQALAEQWQQKADEQREELEMLKRHNQNLLSIVGADTPIAAFTLAETWRAEKQALMDEMAALTAERDELDTYGKQLLDGYGLECARLASAYAQIDRYHVRAGMWRRRVEALEDTITRLRAELDDVYAHLRESQAFAVQLEKDVCEARASSYHAAARGGEGGTE